MSVDKYIFWYKIQEVCDKLDKLEDYKVVI